MRQSLRSLRALCFILACIVVSVNFARPAPLVLAAGQSYSEAAQSVAEGESREKRKCPCPSEIENADCDEGLCGAWIDPHKNSFPHPGLRGWLVAGPHRFQALRRELDPPPPRVAV